MALFFAIAYSLLGLTGLGAAIWMIHDMYKFPLRRRYWPLAAIIILVSLTCCVHVVAFFLKEGG